MKKPSLVDYWTRNKHFRTLVSGKIIPYRRFRYLISALGFTNTDSIKNKIHLLSK